MSHPNRESSVSHYCGITDTMVTSCGCPDDPDERHTYLRDYARHLIANGGADVPEEWRGMKRVIRAAGGCP